MDERCTSSRRLIPVDNEEVTQGYDQVNAMDGDEEGEVQEGTFVMTMTETSEQAEFVLHQDGGVCGFNGPGGYSIWNLDDMELEEGTNYYLFSQHTSGDPRPLRLWCVFDDEDEDDILIGTGICNGVTGTYASEGIRWFHHGPFALSTNTLKLETESYWPHTKQFVLIPTTNTPAIRPRALKDMTELPELLQISHSGIAEKIATIPDRKAALESDGGQDSVTLAALREPTEMSDNVSPGEMIIVGGSHGHYAFDFDNDQEVEEAFLDFTYCSGDSRPVVISLNGEVIEADFCCDATGGFDPGCYTDIRYGPFPLAPGTNNLSVTTNDFFFPHIHEIRVIDASQAGDEVTPSGAESSENWIAPPTQEMREDMLRAVKSFCLYENTQEPDLDFEPDPDFYNAINCDGLWVCTSKSVDITILHRAAELVCRYIPVEIRRLCLQWRAPLDRPRGPFRLVILDNVIDEQAGDCPDFPDDWKGRNGTANPGCFSSADDFDMSRGNDGPHGELTVHEMTHLLDLIVRQQVDPYFMQEVDDCWKANRHTYQKSYAASDRHEYLAEIATLFIGTKAANFQRGCCGCTCADSGCCTHPPHAELPPGPGGVDFCNKSHLIENDPDGYNLLKSFLIEIKEPDDDSYWWEE